MGVLVSVVLPTFCGAEYVGEAIRSARRQSLTDLEIIVVDDGSTDCTLDAVRHAAENDSRVRIVRFPSNRGVSAARNAAIDRASGSWIALLDDDDRWQPERLERLVHAGLDRVADVVADNLLVLADDAPATLAFPRERMSRQKPVDVTEFVETDQPGWGMRASGFIHPIIRRSFLEVHKLRFDPQLSCGEDFHLYLRALVRGARMIYVDAAYYEYRLRARTIDDEAAVARLENVRRASTALRHDARTFGRWDVIRALERRARAFEAHHSYSLLSGAMRERRFTDARRALRTTSADYLTRRLVAAVRRRAGVPVRLV